MSIWLIFRSVNIVDNKGMDNEYLKKFAQHLKKSGKRKILSRMTF